MEALIVAVGEPLDALQFAATTGASWAMVHGKASSKGQADGNPSVDAHSGVPKKRRHTLGCFGLFGQAPTACTSTRRASSLEKAAASAGAPTNAFEHVFISRFSQFCKNPDGSGTQHSGLQLDQQANPRAPNQRILSSRGLERTFLYKAFWRKGICLSSQRTSVRQKR